MADPEPGDAAGYARRHAGERDATLTPAQRELLGRVIARRIERGAKLDQIARAAATALFDLPADRARRLGRDEALRAFAWESLHQLRAAGATQVVLSPARDACPACVAAGGTFPTDRVPAIPVARCTHPGGCRCRYLAATAAGPDASTTASATDATASPSSASLSTPAAPPASVQSAQPARPWYRTRPPRPHGPRWSEEEREARRPPSRQSRPASPPRPAPHAPPPRPPRHHPPAPPPPPRRQPSPRPPRPHRPSRDTR